MKVDAVVFDMDGVIFDSERIYRMMEHRAAAKYGLPDDRVERFCDLIAGGTKETNRIHFETVFQSDIDYLEFRKTVNEGVDAYGRDPGFDVKPGIRELLKFLKEEGILIGLATSTARERAEYHLKRHGLLEYFDGIVFGDMVSRGKPAPDIYLTACRTLGTEPERTIGVEDSVNGVLSSSAAGLITVMVVDLIRPTEQVKEKADRIYESADEIIGFIRKG